MGQVYGANFTHNVGCLNSAPDILSCLRGLSTETILEAQGLCTDTNCWWPVMNQYDINDQPIDYLRSGEYNQVPIMVGCNGNEGWLFAITSYPPPVSATEYEAFVLSEFGEFGFLVLQEYPISEYGSGYNAIEAIIADFLFVCPANYIAEAVGYANINQPAFMYLFNHTPSWAKFAGAYHGAEVSKAFLN